MATKLDMFNRALAELGHNRTIDSLTSSMIENTRCLLQWDGAYRHVLSAHEWNWLVAETAYVEGAECTDDGRHNGKWIYNRPDDQIRLIAVLGEDGRRVDYDVAGKLIYADQPFASILYLPDEDDPDEWPTAIQDAVAYELASRIALPMSASGKAMATLKQLSAASIARAISNDSAEVRRAGSRRDKYAAARR